MQCLLEYLIYVQKKLMKQQKHFAATCRRETYGEKPADAPVMKKCDEKRNWRIITKTRRKSCYEKSGKISDMDERL